MPQATTFGKYVIRKLLRKQGEYVNIYLANLAKDPEKTFELHVLKQAVSDRSPDFQRFLNEFQTLAGLQHPNIVSVSDMGMVDNKAYYTTPYSGALPLQEVAADGGGFDLEEIVSIGLQLSTALEYLHGKKVIHRDIGPDSVYYERDSRKAIIAGFALVKNFRLTNLTARGLMIPTQMRTTPEQIDDKPYDERTDIYLLGDLLYWLLTGRTAFTIDFKPERPSSLREGIPAKLDKTILKMLRKEPEDRYQTASELTRALSEALKPEEQ